MQCERSVSIFSLEEGFRCSSPSDIPLRSVDLEKTTKAMIFQLLHDPRTRVTCPDKMGVVLVMDHIRGKPRTLIMFWHDEISRSSKQWDPEDSR